MHLSRVDNLEMLLLRLSSPCPFESKGEIGQVRPCPGALNSMPWSQGNWDARVGQGLATGMHPSHSLCVFLASSPLQKPGDGGAEPEPRAAVLRPQAGPSAEGGLAEEAEGHHEELAAALVRAARGPAFLLQGPRRDQAPGEKHMFCVPRRHGGAPREGRLCPGEGEADTLLSDLHPSAPKHDCSEGHFTRIPSVFVLSPCSQRHSLFY